MNSDIHPYEPHDAADPMWRDGNIAVALLIVVGFGIVYIITLLWSSLKGIGSWL
jgi:hypothetical protein